jgi:hypothetical protein
MPLGEPLHYQQQQQQPGQLSVPGDSADQGACWQKASALQPQFDHLPKPWSNQPAAQLYQHQHQQYIELQGHSEPAAVAATHSRHAAEPAAAAAAAAAAAEGGRQGGRGRRSCAGGGGSACWTCLACTYSGNKQIWLRCCVCETAKGDTQPPPALLPHGSSSCMGTAAAGGVCAGGGGRGRGAGRGGRGGTGSGSKQLTLEGLGLSRKQPKGS